MFKCSFSDKFGLNQLFEAIKTGCAQLLIGSDGCIELESVAPNMISTAQTLAPNDVKIKRWQCPYPRYFGFTSVWREEMESVFI